MDPCPGGQVVQYRKREDYRVQIAVQISLRVVDGVGSQDTEGEGERYRNHLNGGTRIYKT